MNKKLYIRILAVLLVAACLMPMFLTARAEEISGDTLEEASSTESCGEGLSWNLNLGKLTVTGSGEITSAPWRDQKDHITEVVLSGVTKVCDEAFKDCAVLKSVDFGSDLKEVGVRSFQNCTGLTTIHLPSPFRLFGPQSFEGCSALETVYCDGGMPSFRDNCLYTGGYLTVYYPANNPWPSEPVMQLMTNFGGRLTVVPGSESAPATEAATEPTTAPTTEPTTAPTTAPTTEATTEPTTEPTTEATTEPTTAPTTEATTEASTEPETLPFMTEATEPAAEPEKKGGIGSIVGLILIMVVITFFIIGALIYKAASRRKEYYDDEDEED